MSFSGTLPMTRRCFFAAPSPAAAAGAAGAGEPAATSADLVAFLRQL